MLQTRAAMPVPDVVWDYADKLVERSKQLAGIADASDAAYYEAGYFFTYSTFKPLRSALNLGPGDTTQVIYTTELDVEKVLVGDRLGVPGRSWARLPIEEQTRLHRVLTEHNLAAFTRQGWYDQFNSDPDPFAPGNLIWEFVEQLHRSTGQGFSDNDRQKIRVFVMAAMMDLDPHRFLGAIRGVAR